MNTNVNYVNIFSKKDKALMTDLLKNVQNVIEIVY